MVKQADGPKAKRRSYTDDDRAAARAVYEAEGPREAERQTGIPKRTISRWAAASGWVCEVAERVRAAVEVNRERLIADQLALAARFQEEVNTSLNLMNQPHEELKIVSDGQVMVPQEGGGAIWQKGGSHVERVPMPRPTPTGRREYMVSAGIGVDKARLLLEQSTDRKDLVHSGSVALQGVPDDELKSALLKVIGKLGDLGKES